MISVRNLFLNGQAGPRDKPGVTLDTPIPVTPFYLPTMRTRNADETVWKILIQSLEGSPTAASLFMRFEGGLSTSGGDLTPPEGIGVYPPNGERYYWTDLRPQWTVLDGDTHRALLPDGDFPKVVASGTMTLPILYIKRIKGGFDHRLRINPSYTDGTTPAFKMTIEAETRYR